MNIVLTTAGMQAIMDAKTSGYKLELGTFRAYRSTASTDAMPYPLTTALLDGNILNGWGSLTANLPVIDELHATAEDIFHMVCTMPADIGDFDFDCIAIYLADGTLLGAGTYERLLHKRKTQSGVTSNILEVEAFIRFASIADVIKVTRITAKRPYSYIREFDAADKLGNVVDNMERIYRITRPTNYLGEGINAFTTFLVHAGMATFDQQGKPYQKAAWVPSDHLAMFGSETLSCRLLTNNTIAIRVNKDQFPMIEHIQPEIPYLIAVTKLGNVDAPAAIRGRLLEATLNVVAEGDDFFDIVMLLPNSQFPDTTIRNIEFGVMLYASNSDLSAQEAVRVALRKFIEMQYAVGRTYKSDADTDPNDVLMPYLGYRTYWAKLNGMVEASTSSTDGRLLSAGQIYDLPDYATGGETILAPVLRATNVWLRYDPSSSGSVTYDVTADRTTVNEGGDVRFTLRTTGLSNGALVAYDVTGIQAEDLSSGSLTGYFTINNNVGIVDLTLAMDSITEGDEDLVLTIVADPSIFAKVVVRDTSMAVNVSAFIALAPSANSGVTTMNEGDSRHFVALCGGVPDGTYLYPTILQSSVANIYDLMQSLPSSLRVLDGRVTFPITAVADKATEGDELLSIGLFRDALFTQSLVTATVLIKDTSKAPTLNARFTTSTTGSENLNGSTVDEGTYLYLIIESTGYAPNTIFNLNYGNSATPSNLEVSDKDFANVRPASVQIDAMGKAIIAYPIANDFADDRELAAALETFHVEVKDPIIGTLLTRAMVYIKDTSRTQSGVFNIIDITDPANPAVVYNSDSDALAVVSDSQGATGDGPKNRYKIDQHTTPIDIGLVSDRIYRLVWIQSPTPTNLVTRVQVTMANAPTVFENYGVGFGEYDLNSATAGKEMTLLKDENDATIGYGAIFEFKIKPLNVTGSVVNINLHVRYPAGVPNLPWAVAAQSDYWTGASWNRLPVRPTNTQASIIDDWNSAGTQDPKYSMYGKTLEVPFGGYADFLIIAPSGAGATSSLPTSGNGGDGENGRPIKLHIPKFSGKSALLKEQPILTDGSGNPYYKNKVWQYIDLWNKAIDITGGQGGKSQAYDQANTNLGGVCSSLTVEPTLSTILDSLEDKLFARASNANIQYEFICEVLHQVSGEDWQNGTSIDGAPNGGLGLLPLGSLNLPENIKGKGGNGGNSVGTGYGYGGGGGSGGMYIIRLGTRILDGSAPSPRFAPVNFHLTDAYVLDSTNGTEPLENRRPLDAAKAPTIVGSNVGESGTSVAVLLLDFQKDAYKAMQRETLVGAGTPQVFVRPTHNESVKASLALKPQAVWDSNQFSQLTLPKFSIGRITILPTGVEGSYTNDASEVVDGKPSKPTNLLTYRTLDPANTSPNETVGSTFVYVPSATANTKSSPVLNVGKLATLVNTSVLTSTVKDGDTALADGDNTYSLGGLVDLIIANNSTHPKTFIAELPRVDISDDNPAKDFDETEYEAGKTWSTEVDAKGNSISSFGYKLAEGDGVLSFQPYTLSTIIRLRPWIKYGIEDTNMNDTDAPLILQQGDSVTLTVIGGGGFVSDREPDEEVTENDVAFNGSELVVSIKSLAGETYTPFITCAGGIGSIDNTTNPVASSSEGIIDETAITSCLRIIGTPEVFNGTDNPMKASHGGTASGSYAKVTVMNYYPHPVVLKATGGKGGSGLSDIQVSDGVVLVTVH